ncbi:adenylate/guanylate cyclase domain-containing protein [Pelagibius marinus]|uniref:adenylate/guanylate cyclase domain-containing protein n=1 Tax=Pelagibius marinus TaxID=2762760 RepID=UPI0018733D53|nr:adenylate/guanylate cyclase domain-containing protein [Pelagibius marinus]
MERRLTTILSADVVGYSRLMGEDEAGTLKALKTLRRDLIDPKAQQYRGRTVKLMGDGALMEFASVVDAVSFATEVQAALHHPEAALSENRIVFRIGINIGDIIVEGDDIYGDGVNVAARLQELCEPGGVWISRNVFNQVKGKLDLTFEDLGERQVKNIAEPVTVYRVALDDKAVALLTPIAAGTTSPRRGFRPAIAATAILGLAALLAIAWWQSWLPEKEPASVEQMAFALPDKPSIAVLPFDNLSDDPDQEYFADGMTEDLITDLSKISGLFVIARNSSFVYKGQQVKVRQVAEALGVRYVLEGSVRRVGDEVRINTQLVDATTGGHIWAERYDRKVENIFAVQDAILEKIVDALELHLTEREQSESAKTTSLEAYDLVLRARKLLTRFDSEAAAEARDLLQRAIELDPAYTEAHSLLGFNFFDEWRVWGRGRDENLAQAQKLAAKAAELSPEDPAPHVLLAMIYQWRREFGAAEAEINKALALEPREAITLSNLGSVLVYAGRGEDAVSALTQAIRLDPFHPPNYLEWLGNAYWLQDHPDLCVEVAERGVALDPDYVSLHVVLAVCYGALGTMDKAEAAATEIRRINPRFTLQAYAAYVPYTDDRDRERRVELLRVAGVPE